METKTLQQIEGQVKDLLSKLGLSGQVAVEVGSEENIIINLNEDQEPLGLLIGYHGETLHSLQLILSLLINKNRENPLRIAVDISNYRKIREESLRDLAQSALEKVKDDGQPYEFRPMGASDRRIIHLYLSGFPEFSSESAGEGIDRRVVLKRQETSSGPLEKDNQPEEIGKI